MHVYDGTQQTGVSTKDHACMTTHKIEESMPTLGLKADFALKFGMRSKPGASKTPPWKDLHPH